MSALCLALEQAAAPLPFCASFAKAGKMLPDSWKTRPRDLKEADWGNTCCPPCHVPERHAIEDHNLRLGGADGEAKGLAEAVHAIQN